MQAPDPLAHLACSSCRTPLSSSTASSSLNLDSLASLAPCGHILCSACTVPATGAHAAGVPPSCPVCGTPGLVPRDQATPDVLDCFRPLPDLAQELGTAAGWQTTHLAEQLDYFKHKCAQQKDVLARVGNELNKVKALKQQVAQLNADNADLRNQLSTLARQNSYRQNQPLEQTQHTQHEYRFAGLPPDPSQSRKRRLIDSPDRLVLPVRPATHASTRPRPPSRSSGSGSSGHPTHLTLGPARLSLTPAQSLQTMATSLNVVEEVDERVGQGSLRDRIAKFAYDPSRAAAARTAANTPRPASHALDRQPIASTQHDQAPFAALQHPNSQQYDQYDTSYRDEPRQQEPSFETDAQLMPPPPPPRRRHDSQHHQQQPSSQQRDAFVPPASLARQQPTPSRQHAGTPRPRFESTHASAAAPSPARFVPANIAPHPPSHRPLSTPFDSSTTYTTAHRPLRPASAMLHDERGGGGGGAGASGASWTGASAGWSRR
ncbi:uncharacterized protein RHOBADRAFT_43517 [Rhodotorula graminis WP1]|uniref:RING-type domain-containing protein n=1 Tax=Rhodotorula graminis (strain WP1) TaxID=578459 RepID=A0A194S6A7_RHOGW|nr:uncharacterized protein RHOBADRAFT_43517 [Rhodotorula graminis WP1]KPV76079.1 hypothetical protein RHOBADRAFT_43517 [Rhodotorula graminis WP1]